MYKRGLIDFNIYSPRWNCFPISLSTNAIALVLKSHTLCSRTGLTIDRHAVAKITPAQRIVQDRICFVCIFTSVQSTVSTPSHRDNVQLRMSERKPRPELQDRAVLLERGLRYGIQLLIISCKLNLSLYTSYPSLLLFPIFYLLPSTFYLLQPTSSKF